MNPKTKESVMNGLLKACTKPDGTLTMDLEELEDMAEYIMEQSSCGVTDDGYVYIAERKKE